MTNELKAAMRYFRSLDWGKVQSPKLPSDVNQHVQVLLDAARDFETAEAEVLRLRKTIGRAYNCFHVPGKGAVECQIILERAVERGDSIDEADAETVAQRTVDMIAERSRVTEGEESDYRMSAEDILDAFESGYIQGHDATVEGRVTDSKDAANDYLRSVALAERKACEWGKDNDGVYRTGCGHEWAFDEEYDDPADFMYYCPFRGCGLPIEIKEG